MRLGWGTDADAMPALRRRLVEGCRRVSLGAAASAGVWGVAALLCVEAPRAQALLWGNLAVCALVAALARRVQAVLALELVVLVGFVSHAAVFAALPWGLGQPISPMALSLIGLGAAANALLPLRPAVSAALNLLCGLGSVLGVWLSPSVWAPEIIYMAVVLPVFVLGGVLSGGLQRHVWAWLHREQLHLASADRLTELGRRTAAIAHELNTPLAAASNALHEAEALQRELCESLAHPDVGELDLVEIAEDLSREIEGARASMARMAEFLNAIQSQAVARPRGAQMEQIFFLRARLEGVLEMLARAGDARAARVVLGGVDAKAQLRGDPGSFDQLILSLLDNALAQPSASGRVWVETDFSGAAGRLVVRDEGPGVPASMQERIFEAMVTTRAAQGHAGMGLAISRDIARGVFAGELRLLPGQEGASFALESPFLTRHLPWGQS
jgi:signal transduction histidine kinase